MRWVSVALALVMAGCRPPAVISPTASDTGTSCRTFAMDPPARSMSMRFDSSGHMVFAVEKRKISARREKEAMWFTWNRDGELIAIVTKTTRPSGDATEGTTFRYGPHHELLEVDASYGTPSVPSTASLEWRGAFQEVPSATRFRVPFRWIPGFNGEMPESLVSPSSDDPMPAFSFTGDVSILYSGPPTDSIQCHYEQGLLLSSHHTDTGDDTRWDPEGVIVRNTFDEQGRQLSTQRGTSVTKFVWDGDRVVRRISQQGEASDEVDYEYAADGRLARERMMDSSGRPIGNVTWSDACPSE